MSSLAAISFLRRTLLLGGSELALLTLTIIRVYGVNVDVAMRKTAAICSSITDTLKSDLFNFIKWNICSQFYVDVKTINICLSLWNHCLGEFSNLVSCRVLFYWSEFTVTKNQCSYWNRVNCKTPWSIRSLRHCWPSYIQPWTCSHFRNCVHP